MSLWSLITLPFRTTINSILLFFSIFGFALRLTWAITWLVPLFSYISFVLFSSFILYASHNPQISKAVKNNVFQVDIAFCLAMSSVTEVPHYIIPIKVGIILYVKLLGVLGHWLGWLFMLLDVANILGCVYLYAENIRSVETLLRDFQTTSSSTDSRFQMGALMAKSLSPVYPVSGDSQLIIYKSVSYYTPKDLLDESIASVKLQEEGLLDVYVCPPPPSSSSSDPAIDEQSRVSSTTLKPVVLYVHGGAWTMGSKEQPCPFIRILAERGFVVVTVNYRLAPQYPQPAGFEDVRIALRWTRENIAAFGGDADFILTSGDSAGGHLAQLTALTAAGDRQQGRDHAAAVQGSILFSPLLEVLDEFGNDPQMKSFLINRVCAGDVDAARALGIVEKLREGKAVPPMLVFHGENDNLVDLRSIVDVRAKMKGQGSEMQLVTLKETHHAFMIFNSPRTIAVGHLAADWAMKLFQSRKKNQ